MRKGSSGFIRLRRFLPEAWKRLHIRFLKGINLYALASFYIRKMDQEDTRMRAAFMAFNFMLAVFPAMIFFFTLVAYLPIENAHDRILGMVENLLPDNAFAVISETLTDIVSIQRGGLLSFGFLLAMYFSTSAIDSTIRSFHRSLKIRDKRHMVKKKLYSFIMNAAISLLLLLALVLITLGDSFLNELANSDWVSEGLILFLLKSMNWLVVIGLILFSISIMYKYGPKRSETRTFFSPGSILATILILLTSIGLSIYVNYFNAYNKLYGSIGTLIVVMLWVYWNCLVTLISFELNLFLEDWTRRKKREQPSENRMVQGGKRF